MRSATSGSRDPRPRAERRLPRWPKALRVRPLAAALKAGTLEPTACSSCKRNRFGEGLLRDDDLRRPAWEALRKVWSRPRIRDEFAE